jgi:phosphoribosylanthranilate isomerase
MTKVKICGLRDLANAQIAADAGADFVGFNFAPVRRYVSPDTAREIVRELPASVQKVGLFVNEDPATIRAIVRGCGLDYAQLCGDESPEFCRDLGVPAVKSLRVQGPEIAAEVARYADHVAWCILDGYRPNAYGGTGTTFDWSLARELAGQFPIMVAGGLTPENVAAAIELVAPWGVDVSSGVETDGVKDPVKIVAFLEAARRGTMHREDAMGFGPRRARK